MKNQTSNGDSCTAHSDKSCCCTENYNTFFKDRFKLGCLKEYLNKCGCSMVLFYISIGFVVALGILILCLLCKNLKNIQNDSSLKVHASNSATLAQCMKENTIHISCENFNYPASVFSSSSNSQDTLLYLVGFIVLIMFFLILIGVVCLSSYRKSFMQFYLDDKDMALQFEKEKTKIKIEKEYTQRNLEKEITKRIEILKKSTQSKKNEK